MNGLVSKTSRNMKTAFEYQRWFLKAKVTSLVVLFRLSNRPKPKKYLIWYNEEKLSVLPFFKRLDYQLFDFCSSWKTVADEFSVYQLVYSFPSFIIWVSQCLNFMIICINVKRWQDGSGIVVFFFFRLLDIWVKCSNWISWKEKPLNVVCEFSDCLNLCFYVSLWSTTLPLISSESCCLLVAFNCRL